MRIWLAFTVFLLLGAQTASASAGMIDRIRAEALLPCGEGSAEANLCRDVAAALLGPAARINFSYFLHEDWRARGAAARSPDAVRAPVAGRMPDFLLPMRPVNAAWQAHMDRVVSRYGQLFGAGPADRPLDLPPVPAALWPGGDPFTQIATP